MSRARRWAPSIAWSAVILVATSLPGSTFPSVSSVPGADKVVHGVMYGVLGFLVTRALDIGRAPGWGGRVSGGLAAIAAFGALDEWHQRWIPGRGADSLDWGADVAGAAFGTLLYLRSALERRETST